MHYCVNICQGGKMAIHTARGKWYTEHSKDLINMLLDRGLNINIKNAVSKRNHYIIIYI